MVFYNCHTQWTKLGNIDKVSFVGKDVVCYGTGCFLLFIDTITRDETIYAATSKASGEGVSTYVGNRSSPVFAFAESCSKPRIFVKTYPDFENICVLTGGTPMGYICLGFSDTSLLVSLCTIPMCDIVVWNWRVGIQIKYIKGFMVDLNQSLKSSLYYPTRFGQVAIGTCKLHIWDVTRCGKKCLTLHHIVRPKGKKDCMMKISNILWTNEGSLYVLDTRGNVFTVNNEYNLDLTIEYNQGGTLPTTFTLFKIGLAVFGPTQELRYYVKKSPHKWEHIWKLIPPEPMVITSNAKDILVGVTPKGNIIRLNVAGDKFEYLKISETRINDFCLVYPTGEYVVSLAQNTYLTVWDTAKGMKQDIITLDGIALALSENPEYPYVVVGFAHGAIELFSVYTPGKITSMVSLQLCKDAINSISFTEISKLYVAANTTIGLFFVIDGVPGGSMKVVGHVNMEHQVASYILIPSRTCYRLFAILITSDMFIAGNRLVRYCIIKNQFKPTPKEYKLDDPDVLYSMIYPSQKDNRDRVFYAVPLRSKEIHEIETKRADDSARTINKFNTGHQMCKIQMSFGKHAILTYAFDGLIMIRNADFDVMKVIMPHHRSAGGICKAIIDPTNKYVVSLGRENNLVCSLVEPDYTNESLLEELRDEWHSARVAQMFEKTSQGFLLKGESENKTWFEIQEMRTKEAESVACKKEKEEILREFKSIKTEIQQLLTSNLEGPDNERLDMQQFNLNAEWAENLKKHNADLCRHTKEYLEALIVAQDQVASFCKKYFWDGKDVPAQKLRAISDNSEVDNYVVLPNTYAANDALHKAEQWRTIELLLAREDSFQPWQPKSDDNLQEHLKRKPCIAKDQVNALVTLDDEEEVEKVIDFDTALTKKSTATSKFIEPNKLLYTQCEVQAFYQTYLQEVLTTSDIFFLKVFHNKQFDFTKSLKIREMVNVKERLDRLRYIISEINYFSANKLSIFLTDPQWCQDENPEQIMKVEDSEVGVLPYISPSEQAIIEAKAAEAERIRLLLLADDFRERALMAMMNGVLEVRWEDELRKEVPVPAFMAEKDPETYTEEDIRAVKDYEEKVKFLQSERERYMNLLYTEYAKVKNTTNEGMKKFNARLQDLLVQRLEVHSVILQNELHIHRYHAHQVKRIALDDEENSTLESIRVCEQEIASLGKVIPAAHSFLQEFKGNAENVQAKERALDKAFKKEFSDFSSVIQEVATKLYKKRPKAGYRNIGQVSLLAEVCKCLLTQEISPVVRVSPEAMDFLKAMDALDAYIGIPGVVDEAVYAIVCKHRRIRIDNEIKSRISALQLSEGENSLQMFQNCLHAKKELCVNLYGDLAKIRNQKLDLVKNIQVQLVLKQGQIEVLRTGSIEDFSDAVLVCKRDVEDINEIILKTASLKLSAMREQMHHNRNIKFTEWTHKRTRMRIADLKEQLIDIDSIKPTRQVLNCIKNKVKGKGPVNLSIDQEIDLLKGCYENALEETKSSVRKLQRKIQQLKWDNKLLDKEIENCNVDVCEYNLHLDPNLPQKERDVINERIKTLTKRSAMVKLIQDTHNEVNVCETELELLRLKTFPVLKFKILY